MKPAAEESYVVGTSEAELARLLRQHALFRPACMEAWRKAGVAPGLRVLDVGAGPGAAALDLAALVGPAGSVVAVERNSRFVSHGQTRARASGLAQLEVLQADLLRDPLPAGPFDLIWCRWVAVYLEDGARLVERLVPLLGQGGRMLFLETIDWSTLALHGSDAGTAAVAGFGRGVDRAIAASGGDPVLARRLPGLLAAAGLQLEVLEPLVLGGDAAVTEWLADVIALMGPELVRQGIWTEQDLTAARAALQRAQNQPGSYAVGPLQLWIQARRP